MFKWILAAGAAALALSTPVLAQQGGGNKGGGGKPEKAAKADHGGGGGGKQARIERGGDVAPARGNRARSEDKARTSGKVERMALPSRSEDRGRIVRDGKDSVRAAQRKPEKVEKRVAKADRDTMDSGRMVRLDDDRRGERGLIDGCPPGLARKANGCLPPGRFQKLGSALSPAFASRMLDGAYQQWYRDDERFFYRDDGDYIYRVNRNGGLIDALFPLADRDFSYYPVGMDYPSQFDQYNVPQQFQSFYPDGGDYDYRYGDGAIYQVDPSTNAIQSIVALLAGDLGVGQQMPVNYGAYNVPLDYRDRYYDTPDAMYRYNDGYIYQADPKTQLITAVIDAIV